MKPVVSIEYCPKCGWLMRAAWLAQELLFSFTDELGGVTLIPSDTAGKFVIMLNQTLVHDRAQHGGFPEIKHLKDTIRNHIAPDKSLGHVDKALGKA